VLSRAQERRDLLKRLDQVAAEATLEAEQRERLSVAAELHDGVVQELIGAALLVAALQTELVRTGTVPRDGLSTVHRALEDAQSHCRTLSRGVFHDAGAAAALGTALRALAHKENAGGRIRCRYIGPVVMPASLRDVAAHHLLRIAQEAVRNAVRHSGGSAVVIRLALRPQQLVLSIRDNGRGLPAGAGDGAGGIGWHTMRFRADLIGGELLLEDGPRAGSQVTVTVRLEDPRTRAPG